MDNYKIGVIKKPIIFWSGIDQDDKDSEWGKIGMQVIIRGVTDNHYFISDPTGVIEPIYALKYLIEEFTIKWQRLR